MTASASTVAPASHRRAVLGSAAAAMLLAPLATASATTAGELDGELLRLCADCQAMEADERRLIPLADAAGAAAEAAGAALDGLRQAYREALDRIAGLRALTPEGLRAKAVVVRR